MEGGLDRSVVSQSILKSIALNKTPNPAFELVPSEWKMPDSCTSTVPGAGIKRGLENNQENQEPVRQKSKLHLFLKKGSNSNSRFSKPVSAEELRKAAKGVTPVNTQSSNDWA